MDAYRPQRRRRSDSLEQGLDRLVSAGRQLVDGVSGARPGSRPPARGAAALPRLGDLGRWVENQLDGLLDEDDDDWREPWQRQPGSPLEPALRAERPEAAAPPSLPPPPVAGRRPLQAISRRGSMRPAAATAAAAAAEEAAWPDDDAFTLPRWRRDPLRPGPGPGSAAASDAPGPAPPGRPLPRSSRRRAD